MRNLKKALPIILSAVSVVGAAGTAVLAVRATPKALRLIKRAEDDKKEPLTKAECVKTAWKCYIPAAGAFLGTTACIIGAAILNKRQQTALASAYALVSNAYSQYQAKTKELYGEEAHKKIVSAIAVERAKDVLITSDSFFTRTTLEYGDEEEEVTFYDKTSNRTFISTVN